MTTTDRPAQGPAVTGRAHILARVEPGRARRRLIAACGASAVLIGVTACGFTNPAPVAVSASARQAPPGSDGAVRAPSTVPPAPPAPVASTEVFTDPVRVARAWMTQWCATSHTEPINGNVARAAVFATPDATAADTAGGDSVATYREVVEQQLDTRCDGVTAEISPEAPTGPQQVFVVITADRTRLAASVPLQVESTVTVRSVLRVADGRWLVDLAVDAG